jgi:hypothetical protein
MPTGLEWLDVMRVDSVMQGLVDTRERPADLLFLNRTAETPATNGEIMSRETRRIHISDVIAHDGRAAVYTTGKATLESMTMPKIKHGYAFNESELLQFAEIRADGRLPGGSQWQDFETRVADDILTGIRQRQEQLLVAMACDGVTYDRMGIKIAATFGMPADLKVTVAIPWTVAATATPINDILALKFLANVRYGINFTRLTMSTPVLQAIVATAEFQAKARMYLAPNVSYVNIPTSDYEYQRGLLENVTKVSIVTYDNRYWAQDIDTGTYSSAPYLPLNKVIFDTPANDNNRQVQDFANGVVVESMFTGMGGGAVQGNLRAPRRGPIQYATINPALDPPGITYWGVMAGFPRKKMLQANACLTVGTITDFIPVGEPF